MATGPHGETPAPREPGPPAQVGRLVHRLAEIARSAGATVEEPDEAGEGVLLDVETDGIRCVLIDVPSATAPVVALSPRERDIARLVAQGYPNKSIAAMLEISPWTVSSYLRRIFGKLGVHARSAMVARVLEEAGGGRFAGSPSPARPGQPRARGASG